MRALLCERHGPPEDLVLREAADPVPGAGQIVIAVRAAGVNFPDGLIIRNMYQIKPDLPFAPGGEAAGVVEAVGEGVTGFKPGDRVCAMTLWGSFAEKVAVDADAAVHIPDEMPFDEASGFTMVYATGIHAFVQRAALQPGETVLVLGAAGGVGIAAIEIAKAMGARVVAAASTPEKLELARAHGADALIDYSRPDFREQLRAATDGKGPDVVYDPVGGDLAEQAFRSIAPNGRYLVVGFAAGTIPAIPLNLPLVKSAAIVGVFWGAFMKADPETHAANMEQLFAWYRAGAIRPEISRRFGFEEGAAAIRWVMDRKALGKVVVTMDAAG
ncbi:NADPH:quinone oxidoreductase family protein [Rhizorhabdus sp.]|uniref:NADPH:quinone oxidoreductase family protein n=1 Tax=Rhizorhabdus sp. TaxID=1968843 RepID=UPI00344D0B26